MKLFGCRIFCLVAAVCGEPPSVVMNMLAQVAFCVKRFRTVFTSKFIRCVHAHVLVKPTFRRKT